MKPSLTSDLLDSVVNRACIALLVFAGFFLLTAVAGGPLPPSDDPGPDLSEVGW